MQNATKNCSPEVQEQLKRAAYCETKDECDRRLAKALALSRAKHKTKKPSKPSKDRSKNNKKSKKKKRARASSPSPARLARTTCPTVEAEALAAGLDEHEDGDTPGTRFVLRLIAIKEKWTLAYLPNDHGGRQTTQSGECMYSVFSSLSFSRIHASCSCCFCFVLHALNVCVRICDTGLNQIPATVRARRSDPASAVPMLVMHFTETFFPEKKEEAEVELEAFHEEQQQPDDSDEHAGHLLRSKCVLQDGSWNAQQTKRTKTLHLQPGYCEHRPQAATWAPLAESATGTGAGAGAGAGAVGAGRAVDDAATEGDAHQPRLLDNATDAAALADAHELLKQRGVAQVLQGAEDDEELDKLCEVNLATGTCTCTYWRSTGLPCVHALTLCEACRRCDDKMYVHHVELEHT